MEELTQHIKSLKQKIQLLAKRHQSLKKENESLLQKLSLLEKQNAEYAVGMQITKQKLAIKSVHSLAATDEQKKALHNLIDGYIKEINKCLEKLNA